MYSIGQQSDKYTTKNAGKQEKFRKIRFAAFSIRNIEPVF